MRRGMTFAAALLSGGLAGCTVAQPPPQPAPLVAVPGPAKAEAEFRQDDTACRAAAVVLPPNPSAAAQPGAAPVSSTKPADQAVAQTQDAPPPGLVYLRCMEARHNIVEPLTPVQPAPYGYYASYPIYDRSPYYYGGSPFFFGSFGFYGGGYRRHYGGYNHHGFHGGGFHGGGFGHGGGGHGGHG